MSEEVPRDVREELDALLTEAARASRNRDADAVERVLDTVEARVSADVPAGAGRERLRHGCAQVRQTVESEPLVATEYLESMRRLLEEDDGDDAAE